MTKPHEWSSREQWAAEYQRPIYDDGTCGTYADNYSRKLSDYATPEELAALTTTLKDFYGELGRELKAVNLRIKPSDRQQRGEKGDAWYRRFTQLPEEDQVTIRAARKLQESRSTINRILTQMGNDGIADEIPNNRVPGKASELAAPISARYKAARKAAYAAYIQKYAATHVPDDAAWERELRRRAEREAMWGCYTRPRVPR